MDDGI